MISFVNNFVVIVFSEARVASSVGQGFYTIGPCGEELLGVVGLHLRPTDPAAFHYRHVASAVMRQLMAGKTPAEICLDRARGFTCSTLDPVTGIEIWAVDVVVFS